MTRFLIEYHLRMLQRTFWVVEIEACIKVDFIAWRHNLPQCLMTKLGFTKWQNIINKTFNWIKLKWNFPQSQVWSGIQLVRIIRGRRGDKCFCHTNSCDTNSIHFIMLLIVTPLWEICAVQKCTWYSHSHRSANIVLRCSCAYNSVHFWIRS